MDLINTDPLRYAAWVGFAIFSICFHESAHARVAVKFGDNTPKDYIALNPMKQMGWLSIGLLLFIGIAWGSVPVNPHGAGDRRKNALVYLAGPASNLLLCAVFALLAQTAMLWELEDASRVLMYGAYVNGALCLLNLLPVPPLDGFGAIRSLITDDVEVAANLNRFAGIGLILLWVTPVGSYLFQYGAQLAAFFSTMWLVPFQVFS